MNSPRFYSKKVKTQLDTQSVDVLVWTALIKRNFSTFVHITKPTYFISHFMFFDLGFQVMEPI